MLQHKLNKSRQAPKSKSKESSENNEQNIYDAQAQTYALGVTHTLDGLAINTKRPIPD